MNHIKENYIMEKSAVAFGCFDGLHPGHKSIIQTLIANTAEGESSIVLSLDYRGYPFEEEPEVIYTEDEKADLVKTLAVDTMTSFSLDRKVCSMEAEDFIRDILVRKLGAVKIIAGENICFGKDRTGNIELLAVLSEKYGYELIRCPLIKSEGRVISTEWIKTELKEGDLETANRLLGRPFTIYGEVIHGKALGRTVGMPTANLKAPNGKLMPKFGVYGSLSEINSSSVMGLTNLGRRPSVDDFSYVTIETFLLDFSSDIYGEKIALELHAYIRGVVKFPNLEAVKDQVEKDMKAIRNELEMVFAR